MKCLVSEILAYQSSWQEQAWRCFTHHSPRMCRKRPGEILPQLHLHFSNWNFSLNPPHGYCLSRHLLKNPIFSLLIILPCIISRCFTHTQSPGWTQCWFDEEHTCMLLPQKVFRAAAIRAQKETLGMLFAFGPRPTGADVWSLSIGPPAPTLAPATPSSSLKLFPSFSG